jgi:hypothetical protein
MYWFRSKYNCLKLCLNHQRFPTLVRFKKDSSLIRVRFHCTTIRAFSLLCKYVHTHLFTIHLLDVVVRQLNGSLLYTECFNKHSLNTATHLNIFIAIWMLPVSYHYGGWPRSGEIDIMESRGNEFETNDYICIMAICN